MNTERAMKRTRAASRRMSRVWVMWPLSDCQLKAEDTECAVFQVLSLPNKMRLAVKAAIATG